MTSRVIYGSEKDMTLPHQAIERWQTNLFGRYAEKDVQHLVTLDNAGRHVSLCNQWNNHLPFEVQSWEYPDLPICVRCLQSSGQLRRLVVWVKPNTVDAIKKQPERMQIIQEFLNGVGAWDDADWNAAEKIWLRTGVE